MGLRRKSEVSMPLRSLVPLNSLSDEQLCELLEHVSLEKAKRGEYLFREGDNDPEYVYLLSGKVALLSGGKEVEVVSGGTPATRIALAHNFPRRYSARAKGRVQFLRIENRYVSRLQQEDGGTAYEVSEIENESDGDWLTRALQSTIFQRIPTANLQSLAMRMRKKELVQGEIVIEEGDRGDSFFVLGEGRCRVTRKDGNDGNTIELAQLGEGDSFGEEALIFGQPRQGTVTMITDGILAEITKVDFIELIAKPLCKEVGYPAAEALISTGAVWLDIREPQEFAKAHLPDALNIPMKVVRLRAGDLDPERGYVVCGDETAQLVAAAFWLNQQGLSAVVLQPTIAELFGQEPLADEDKEVAPDKNDVFSEESADWGADGFVGNADPQQRSADDAELEVLHHRLNDMQQDVVVLERCNRISQEAAAQSDKEKRVLEQRLAEATARLTELQMQSEQRVNALREEKEQREASWEKQRERLEQQLNEGREHARMLEAERETLRTEIGLLQQRLERIEARHAEQEGRLKEEITLLVLQLEEAQTAAAPVDEEAGEGRLAVLAEAVEEKERLIRQQEVRRQELERENGSYAEELASIRAHLAEQEAKHTALAEQYQADLQDLEQALEKEMDARQRAEEQLEAQRKEGGEQQQTANERISALLDQRGQLEQRLRILEEKLDASHQKADDLEKRLHETRELLNEADVAQKETESKEQKMLAELEEQRQEHDRLRESYRQLEADGERALHDVQGELESLKSELRKARDEENSELAALRSSHEETLAALDDVQRERQEAQQQLQEVLEKSEEVNAEREQLGAALEKAEQEAALRLQEMEQLRDALAASESRLKEAAEEQQQRVTVLRQEITELHATVTEQQEQLRQAESEQAALKEQLAQRGHVDAAELASLEQDLKEARAQLSARMESELAVAEEREAMQQRITALEEELAEAVRQHESLKVERHDLQDGVKRLQSSLESLQEESTSWKQKADEQEERSRVLEENIERLEVQLRAAQNRSQYERFTPPPEGMDAPRRIGRTIFVLLLAVLLGALSTFGAIDAYLMASGEGELLQRFQDRWVGEQPPTVRLDPKGSAGDMDAEAPLSLQKEARPVIRETRPAVPKKIKKPSAKASVPASKKHMPLVQDRLFDGGTGPAMVRIPAGTFTMGGKGALAAAVEQPLHNVRIKSFFMSRDEVTFDDYDQFVQATGREVPDDEGWGRGNRPVINVTWEDAFAYAEWLTQQSGHEYRLPSEAQWEYAASAGGDGRYWWGDDAGKGRAVCAGCGTQWDDLSTAPAGRFTANPFGLHDIAGNVMEWTADCYNPGYEGAPADGAPWLQGDCSQRVVRGGAFNTPPERMRSAGRQPFSADSGFSMIGFRLVRLD